MRPTILVSLASLVGLALRAIYFNTQEFWGDEVFAISVVKHFPNFSDLLNYLKVAEVYPPLYYWLLHKWAYWFGFSNGALRSLALIFGVATIPLAYAVAKEMFSTRAAILAAWLVALLPIHIYYSQVIRAYVMFAAVALLTLWFFLKYIKGRQVKWLLGYVLAAAAGLYLHYSFVLFLFPVCLYWLGLIFFTEPPRSRQFIIWLSTHAAIALLFSPWLPIVLYKAWGLTQYDIYGYARGEFIFDRTPDALTKTFYQLIWFSKNAPVNILFLLTSWLFQILAIGLVVRHLVFNGPQVNSWLRQHRFDLALLAAVILGGSALYTISAMSLGYTPVPEQHILFVAIFIIILLAAILSELPRRSRNLLVAIFIVSLFPFVWTVVDDDSAWDPTYRMSVVADFINFNYQPGDLVIVGNVITRTDLNYYLRPELSSVAFYPIPFIDNDVYASRDTLGLAENEFHFRIRPVTPPEAYWKLRKIIERYKPKRVFLAYFPSRPYADQFFDKLGWWKKISSNNNLMPLDLWEMPHPGLSNP